MRSLYLEHVGEVHLRKNIKNRRVKITVRAHQPVLVTMPKHLPWKEAERFLFSQKEWITEQLRKLQKSQRATAPVCALRSARRSLKLLPNPALRADEISTPCRVTKETIIIEHPAALDPEEQPLRGMITAILEKVLRKEAREILPPRIERLARLHGFTYSRLALNRAKTRWGSCSAKKSINLNIALALLPERLMDYVILHELAHTREPNHGPGFWRLMEKVCPGAKRLDKELRGWSPTMANATPANS